MLSFLTAFLPPKDNSPEIASLLVKLLNINISDSTLLESIQEHPNYPSLLAISDVLDRYGIENLTVRVEVEKLPDVQCPFITQIKGESGSDYYFTIVKKINSGGVSFFDPEKHQWVTTNKNNFIDKSSGIILLTEVRENAGENIDEFKKKIKAERRLSYGRYFVVFAIPLVIALICVNALYVGGNNALLPSIFLLFSVIGSLITAVLLMFEVDEYNPLFLKICQTGKKVNCKAVMQSKGSKIFGLSWSCIGFAYFAGLLLFQAFNEIINPLILSIVSSISFLASFYIIYSLFYQWKIVKQWCVLCLCIQGILFSQLIISFIGAWQELELIKNASLHTFLQLCCAFLIPFLSCYLLQTGLKKAKMGDIYQRELQRLKRDPSIFELLLNKQKKLRINSVGLGITLGNPNATYKIIKVCNPYCAPCAKAHKPIEEILHQNSNIQLQIIFTATNNDEDIKSYPVRHLLSIAESNNDSKTNQALNDWYLAETKDYQEFAKKYPMGSELKQQGSKIDAMKKWCDDVEISFTPTFFLSFSNKDQPKSPQYFQLPDSYAISDLKYLIEPNTF